MVRKIMVPFTPAEEKRCIHIYLPDDYEYVQERYPVTYMFDGHNLFFDWDATYGKSLGMKEFLDGWHKKMIVVGIPCSADDWQRVQEYCPYRIYSKIYGDIDGKGGRTAEWIVGELKPFIDRTFRTWPFREATAIAGYSMGGMMALFCVLRCNETFSKAAVISPSILPAMEDFKREIWEGSFFADTRIFFSWGTREYAEEENWHIFQSILYLEKEVQKKGVRTYIHCQQGGEHNEWSWEKQLPVWMPFLWL